MNIYVKRFNSDVKLPKPAHRYDGGVDLESTVYARLVPGEQTKIATGIAVQIPIGYAGFVTPRSGLAARGLGILNSPGLIDSGYRGEICVLLINHSSYLREIEPGDRIAQLVILALPGIDYVEVEELGESERGTGGFGSTGR